jgi:hypothetical protein
LQNPAERQPRAKKSLESFPLATSAMVIMAAWGGLAVRAWAGTNSRTARAARSLNVHDEGRLHFTKASGSQLTDEGHATGTFPGWVTARFTYNGEPTVSASFTIRANGGSISARGSGRLSSPVSPAPSFRGHIDATGGSGRYAHVHGSGELFGVFNRRSYGLIVQAIGKLSY